MKFNSLLRRFRAACSVRCPHRIFAAYSIGRPHPTSRHFRSCVASTVPSRLLALAVLLTSGSWLLTPTAAPGAVRYPITIISGATTGYVDTLILPPGMIVSNLPGGGVLLFATNLTTGASTIPPFSISASYATNAGTATFSSNAGSLNGLPGNSYLTASATNGMATNCVGLTFYVSKLGSDSNPGTQMSPFLTLSNAVAKLSSNIYQYSTYSFVSASHLQNLTNQTFTIGSNFNTAVQFPWTTNNPPPIQNLLIPTSYPSSGAAKDATNSLFLYTWLLSNKVYFLSSGGTITRSGGTVTITAPTGTYYYVGTDMTNTFNVSSNQNFSVTNFSPWEIHCAMGTYREDEQLVLPPQGNIYGAGKYATFLTNATSVSPWISLTASNLLSGLNLTEPASGAQALSTGYDCTLSWVYTFSPFDGVIGGSGRVWIDHCSIWSHGDCLKAGGTLYITDTDAHGIGPQDGFGQTARGNGLNSASAYAWNSTFEAGGNGWNAAVWTGDSTTITNSSGATNFVSLYNCTLTFSNNANSCAFSNNANCIVTEYGCNYDHSQVVGPLLHGIGPQTITINGTTDSSGVVTGYFPVGKVIISANFFPTNNPTRFSAISSLSGTNSVAFTIYTNGLTCNSCGVVGPATGYEQ